MYYKFAVDMSTSFMCFEIICSLSKPKIFLPLMRSGYDQIAQGLSTDTFLEAHVSNAFMPVMLLCN